MSTKIKITENYFNSFKYYGIEIDNNEDTYNFPIISENINDVKSLCKALKNESPILYNDIIRDFILSLAYDKIEFDKIE